MLFCQAKMQHHNEREGLCEELMETICMEKQYIFFNTAKALFTFFVGLLALFALTGYLVYAGISNTYLVVLIIILCSGIISWLTFYLDRK
jgi:hypothetical protein